MSKTKAYDGLSKFHTYAKSQSIITKHLLPFTSIDHSQNYHNDNDEFASVVLLLSEMILPNPSGACSIICQDKEDGPLCPSAIARSKDSLLSLSFSAFFIAPPPQIALFSCLPARFDPFHSHPGAAFQLKTSLSN